jgi:KaiC/GvpD/RAD55 family RecA-like ATPase
LAIERTPTGIPGLDELVGGGIPRGHVVLVMGGPGSGKTILCSQFLHNGAAQHGEKGLFVTLDETREDIQAEMRPFGWDFQRLEAEGLFTFLDASPFRTKSRRGFQPLTAMSLGDEVRRLTKKMEIDRIAVDPVAALLFHYPDIAERRNAILQLIDNVRSTGATCLLTLELRAAGLERDVQVEEYLAHGVLLLQTLKSGSSLVRAVQVEKMRGTRIDLQPRPYIIGSNGIEVYPEETIF